MHRLNSVVCLCVVYDPGKKGRTNPDSVWGLTCVGPRIHVLDWVEIPMGRNNFGIVRPIEKHWESAVVYATKGIIQCSISAWHAMWPFVRIYRPLVLSCHTVSQHCNIHYLSSFLVYFFSTCYKCYGFVVMTAPYLLAAVYDCVFLTLISSQYAAPAEWWWCWVEEHDVIPSMYCSCLCDLHLVLVTTAAIATTILWQFYRSASISQHPS